MRLTQAESDWLAHHKSVRVAFDGYFPPYSYLNEDGKFEGLAVDMIHALAKRAGITIEISPKAVWKDLYEAAQKREVDLVATMGKQPEREQWFVFTQPYIFKSLVIMTRTDEKSISAPADLEGRTVAVVRSYQYVRYLLEKYPSITPLYVDTMLDGLNAVAVGKADAAITFLGAGHYFKTRYQMANLKFAAVYDRDRFTECIAVRKDWPELASLLNKALDSISGEEMHSLQEKWLPPEAAGTEQIALTREEKAWIRDHPVIRVGVNPEFAPYAYIAEDGTFRGIASDYIELLNRRLGLNMQAVPGLTWKEAVDKARKGEIDVLPGVAVTEERKEFLGFSEPYINFYRVIITRKDAPVLTGIEDIRGLRVAVQADTVNEAYLKEHTDITPVSYQTLQEALQALSVGRTDALVHNLAAATFWMTKMGLTNLKVAAPLSGGSEALHFAVRKDWPALIGIINKGLLSIGPEERIRIQQHWVTVELPQGIARETVIKYLAIILGLIVSAAAGFTAWNRSLKRQVDRKTAELQRELEERKKTEGLLTVSESKYRRLHESMMDGYGYVDMSGTIRDSNEAFRTMLGYSAEELGRLGYPDITPQRWHEEEKRIIEEQVLKRGYSDVYEKEYIRKDGAVIPVELRTFLVKDESGGNEGMWAVVRDITERKKAEKELLRNEQVLRLFVENSPAAIAMFDREMRYIVASRRFLTDYRLGDQDIIGRSHYDVFPEMPERWKEIHRRCLAGAIERSEEDPFPRSDGNTDWVRWEIRPWYEADGNVGGIILFSEVVTERKIIQTELEKYRAHLEELVKDRTAELAEKNAELGRMNRLFVGRELRMAELKDKIHQLENRLRQSGLFE